MIAFIESNDSYLWKGYLLGVCLFGISWLRTIFNGHQMNINQLLGMRLRTMITAAVYRKVMLTIFRNSFNLGREQTTFKK
jgi:hypothetical protein